MKETQKILLQMGFINLNNNVWQSDWFGVFILLNDATPEDLAKFIYNRTHLSQMPSEAISYSKIKKKLFSMRYTKKQMQSRDIDRDFAYGWTDCINVLLLWAKKQSQPKDK